MVCRLRQAFFCIVAWGEKVKGERVVGCAGEVADVFL